LYLFSISLAASIIWLYVNSRFRDSSIGSYSILFGILFGYIFFVLITYLAKYKIQFLFMSIIIILMLIIISRSNRTSRKININH
jgi:xanthine/uracil permease